MIRPTASTIRKIADAVMKSAWPRPASGSALPWPKRCSRSAGCSAWRTAKRLMSEASTSITESASDESRLTESVTSQAPSLAAIIRAAAATAKLVARRISRRARSGWILDSLGISGFTPAAYSTSAIPPPTAALTTPITCGAAGFV